MTNNYQLDTNDSEDEFVDDEEKLSTVLEIQFSLCKKFSQTINEGGLNPVMLERIMKTTRMVAYLIQVKTSSVKSVNFEKRLKNLEKFMKKD